MIADWLTSIGLGAVKPVVAALVLPPIPFLALALAGAGVVRTRPRASRGLVLAACLGLWLCSCIGAARWVQEAWLALPAPLDAAQRAALKARAASGTPMAIVVLGGGVNEHAVEYGHSDLANVSLQRLRYGVWLARQTGLPLAGSGGLGWAQSRTPAMPEAQRMAQVARDDYGLPLRWVESTSRDTHENAVDTTVLLRQDGIHEIVLVTNGTHMPRALREFRAAAAAAGSSAPMAVTAAPMGESWTADSTPLDWLPSGEGLQRMRTALHEVLGRLIDRR